MDRLPAETELNLRPQNSSRGNEGISVLALGEGLHSLKADYATLDSLPSIAHVRFISQRDDGGQQVIALPVANTMFLNGRESSIYEDIWEVTAKPDGRPHFHRLSRTPLKSFEVAITSTGGWPYIGIPMLPLTRPCEIGSSIGNVLRELKRGDSSESFPASADLEVAVPQLLKSPWLTEAARSGVSIFALITSKDFYAKANEETRTGLRPPGRRALMDGLFDGRARLHRVTGGGGGWGNKKGLLSLEPGMDVFADKHDLLPLLPAEGENYDFQGASNLASPGDNVQFVAVVPGQQGPAVEPNSSEKAGQDYMERKTGMTFLGRESGRINAWRTRLSNTNPRMAIGTSLRDEAHSSITESSASSGDTLILVHNFFGMLSEGGACLGRTNADAAHSEDENEPVSFTSRLDIPFTTVLAEASPELVSTESGNAVKVSHFAASQEPSPIPRSRSVYRPLIEHTDEQATEPDTHKP